MSDCTAHALGWAGNSVAGQSRTKEGFTRHGVRDSWTERKGIEDEEGGGQKQRIELAISDKVTSISQILQ